MKICGLLVILLLVAYIYPINANFISIPSVHTEQESKDGLSMRANRDRVVIAHDAVFEDCVINGSVLVQGESKVLFNNVTFVGESYSEIYDTHVRMKGFIEIYGDAEVVINNSVIKNPNPYPVTIATYNNSELHLVNTTVDGTMIIVTAYDSSSVVATKLNSSYFIMAYNYSLINLVDDVAITVFTYDFADIQIFGYLEQCFVWARNNGFVYIGNVDINMSQISVGGQSSIYSQGANIYGTIGAENYSYVYLYDTYVDSLMMFNSPTLYAQSSNITHAYIAGSAVIDIDGGEIQDMTLTWGSNPIIEDALGPSGIISNANIQTIWIYSANIIRLQQCSIDTLNYAKVYNGTYVTADALGIDYDSAYNNYMDISSTINNAIEMPGIIIGNGVERITVDSPSIGVILAYDSDNITIVNINTFSTISVWQSELYLNGLSIFGIDLMAYSSNISMDTITISGLAPVSLEMNHCNLNIDNSNITLMEAGIMRSNIHMNNTLLSNTNITMRWATGEICNTNLTGLSNIGLFNYSSLVLNLTVLNGWLNISESFAILDNSTVGNILLYEVLLEDGDFEMDGYVIKSYTGHVISGVYMESDVNIVGALIAYGDIEITNGTLNFSNHVFTFVLSSDRTVFKVYDATLYLYNVAYISGFNLSIKATETANVYLYDSNVTRILLDGYLYLNHTEASEIEVYDSEIEVYQSSIDELDIYNSSLQANDSYFTEIEIISGNITMDNCTVTEEIGGGDFFAFIYDGVVYESYVYIIDSNVSGYHSLCKGNVTIENTVLETVMSAFQHIYLIDTNVSMALNVSLFTEGSIEIDNNNVVQGTPTYLLHKLGSSQIYMTMYAIALLQESPYLNVNISNSLYIALVALGGEIIIDNSQFMMMFIYTDNSVYIKDTIVNGTEMDMPQFLTTQSLYVDNTTFISPMLGLECSGSSTVVNSEVYTIQMFVISSSISFEGTNIYAMDTPANISISDSVVDIENMESIDMIISNSTVDLANVSVVYGGLNSIFVADGTDLYGHNVSIDEIVMTHIFKYMIFVFVPSFPTDPLVRDINIYLENSTIRSKYPKYYYLDTPFGVIIDNESITGDYSLKTKYINSDISSAKPAFMFEVAAYGKASIRGYKGDKEIKAVVVDALTDTTPPEIDSVNGTYVEYELGLEEYLQYVLKDEESPTNYTVELDGVEIMSGTYTNNFVLTVNLTAHITTAGTYTIDIYAYDSEMNEGHNSTTVKVLPAEPPEIITSPEDSYNLTVGEKIKLNWSARDNSPDTYELYVNGDLKQDGLWTSGQIIQYVFDATDVGTYNITIVFKDKIGLSSKHTVTINVKEVVTTSTPTTTTTTTTPGISLPSSLLLALGMILVIVIIAIVLMKKKKVKE